MSTNPVLPNELVSPPTRDPLVRTYCHKGESKTSTKLLPQLKPSPVHRPTKRKLADESPEPELDGETSLGTWPPETTRNTQGAKKDNTYPYEDEYGDDAVDHDERVQYSDRCSSPLPVRRRRTISATDFSDGEESENSEDEGVQYRHNSKAPITEFPNHSTRQPSSAPAITSLVRRKPFLIYNKTPCKSTSFKKLERKRPESAKSNAVGYFPGDGFSDSEARPNGLFYKRRKLHFSAPAVGILDLTQTPPRPLKPTTPTAPSQPKEPRIIIKRKKRARDNSFLPPTPTKARQKRPREKEDAKINGKEQSEETQLTSASGISAQYGQILSSVILGESRNNEQQMPSLLETTENDLDNGIMNEGRLDDETAEVPSPLSDHGLPPIDNGRNDNRGNCGGKRDEICVPYSEDDYVPATQCRQAKSLPPGETVLEEQVRPPRVLRRVRTK